MAQPFLEPLPPDLHLGAGCVVRFTAIDPTTGATVAGVQVTDAMVVLTNLTGGPASDLEFGPFQLVPGTNA